MKTILQMPFFQNLYILFCSFLEYFARMLTIRIPTANFNVFIQPKYIIECKRKFLFENEISQFLYDEHNCKFMTY